jgi:hypothetical protein
VHYKKPDLEKLAIFQLDNLSAQGENIRLINEQNDLLLKNNHELIDELSAKLKEPKPYPIPKREKIKPNDDDVGGALS